MLWDTALKQFYNYVYYNIIVGKSQPKMYFW